MKRAVVAGFSAGVSFACGLCLALYVVQAVADQAARNAS